MNDSTYRASERTCPVCGDSFSPLAKYDYVKLCFTCWHDSKIDSDNNSFDLRNEVKKLKSKLLKAEKDLRNARTSSVSASVITQDKIKRLIMLCHPDKHGASKMAADITLWLLELKK